MCVCMHTCTYKYIRIYTNIYVYIRIYTHIYKFPGEAVHVLREVNISQLNIGQEVVVDEYDAGGKKKMKK